MTSKETLIDQTQKANDLVIKLMDDIPFSDWSTAPIGQKSTILWQVGHLALTQNFHGIMVITGLRPELKHVPLRLFSENFGMGSSPENVSTELSPELVKGCFLDIARIALNGYQQLKEADLNLPLEPTKIPSPLAKIKSEAMLWNTQHLYWHGGQIALLRSNLGLKSVFGKKT